MDLNLGQPLTKYSQILGFALERERMLQTFYTSPAVAELSDRILSGIQAGYRRRIKALERSARENVNEMILERVDALYGFALPAVLKLETVVTIEAEFAAFYRQASALGQSVLAEVAGRFLKFADEHEGNFALLKEERKS